jgi:RNA polymerase sigma-70 factor, ECF subfamily
VGQPREPGEEPTVLRAVRGSAKEFAVVAERHRGELRIHCYRMLGNLDEAEDLVQETLARAWRRRDGFEGRSTFRAWLYRIATNACLDAIRRSSRRVRTVELCSFDDGPPSFDEVPWLQPLPDALIDGGGDGGPDAAVVAKETVELAFLVAIQHLPPRQRAVLILRDVLDWSPTETADALDGTVTAVNSALQRARATLRRSGGSGRFEWSPVRPPTDEERHLLQRYVDAHARADAGAIIELLGDDVRFSMPPEELRYQGRAEVAGFFVRLFGDDNPGDWQLVGTRANGEPAAANYVRPWGGRDYEATTLDVLRMERGRVVEITTFGPDCFATFGLAATLPAATST